MKLTRSTLLLLLLLPLCCFGHKERSTKGVTPEQRAVLKDITDLVYKADYIGARKMAVYHLQRKQNDALFHASILGILGDIEAATDNRRKAFYYFRKIETIFHRNPELMPRMCMIAWKYANLYYEAQQYDSAYYYAQYAIDSCRVHLPNSYDGMLSANLPIIGYHYYLQGDYQRATGIYEQAIAVNQRMHAEIENVNTFLKMADLKVKQSDYQGAVKAADQAYDLADRHDVQQYRLAAVNKLIDLHRQFGNYREAARLLQLKMDLMDAINLAGQKKALQELEAKFHSELKEQENKSLKIGYKKKQRENKFLIIIILLSAIVALAILVFAVIFFGQKRRISRQKARVDRLNMLNQKIFSVISHDFRGPMMGLDLLLGMQEKYDLDAERFTIHTAQLRNDLKQANLILENLLSWSRTELGMNLTPDRECSPGLIGKAVIEQLKGLLTQKQLKVICALPIDQPLAVSADSFTIILRNLLGNAIKFSYVGGEILVTFNQHTGEFAVSDSGVGMDPERREKLFTRQLDSRLGTQRETGFGIGLNLVYELVLQHDGQIRAESSEGKGTTVYFSFKTTRFAPPQRARAANGTKEKANGKEHR
jgi:signal transduction histidine kinase